MHPQMAPSSCFTIVWRETSPSTGTSPPAQSVTPVHGASCNHSPMDAISRGLPFNLPTEVSYYCELLHELAAMDAYEGGDAGGEALGEQRSIEVDLSHLGLSELSARFAYAALVMLGLSLHQRVTEDDAFYCPPSSSGGQSRRNCNHGRRGDMVPEIISRGLSGYGAAVGQSAVGQNPTTSQQHQPQSQIAVGRSPAQKCMNVSADSPIVLKSLLCAAVALDFLGCSEGSAMVGDYVLGVVCTLDPSTMCSADWFPAAHGEGMGAAVRERGWGLGAEHVESTPSLSRINTKAVDEIHSAVLLEARASNH